MTAFGNITDAVQAMKNGAYDYLVKGDDNEKIIPLVYKALEKVKITDQELFSNTKGFGQIIGNSSILQAKNWLKSCINRCCCTFNGETGTEKKFLPMPFMKEVTGRKIVLSLSTVRHSVKKFWKVNFSDINRELLQELKR
jgi:DNA-binding NtrC family response regulator